MGNLWVGRAKGRNRILVPGSIRARRAPHLRIPRGPQTAGPTSLTPRGVHKLPEACLKAASWSGESPTSVLHFFVSGESLSAVQGSPCPRRIGAMLRGVPGRGLATQLPGRGSPRPLFRPSADQGSPCPRPKGFMRRGVPGRCLACGGGLESVRPAACFCAAARAPARPCGLLRGGACFCAAVRSSARRRVPLYCAAFVCCQLLFSITKPLRCYCPLLRCSCQLLPPVVCRLSYCAVAAAGFWEAVAAILFTIAIPNSYNTIPNSYNT